MKKVLCALMVIFSSLFLTASCAPAEKRVTLTHENLSQEISISREAVLAASRTGGYVSLCEKLSRLDFTQTQTLEYLSPALLRFSEKALAFYPRKKEESRVSFYPDRKEMFQYDEGASGASLNKSEFLFSLCRALDAGESALALPVVFDRAESVSEMRERTRLIASFSTYYGASSLERKINVELAAQAVSGAVIESGETFSFNERVGARTEDRGYRIAKTIENGVYVPGVGGGVCQVSSTLFNALSLAGLCVVESHKHTIPASYVPLSRDAMVSAFADLKMRNDSAYPVYVSAKTDGETLSFFIYSKKEASYRLESQTLQKLSPPPAKIVEDAENKYLLKEGELKRISPARSGYVSRLIRFKTLPNGGVEEEIVRSDIYYAQSELIARGVSRQDPSPAFFRLNFAF